MQEQNLTALLSSIDTKQPVAKKAIKTDMRNLAIKNKKDLEYKNLPEYVRTPTAEELIIMRQWAIDYKKEFKSASKRQVRKAVQQHFKIRIFR